MGCSAFHGPFPWLPLENLKVNLYGMGTQSKLDMFLWGES